MKSATLAARLIVLASAAALSITAGPAVAWAQSSDDDFQPDDNNDGASNDQGDENKLPGTPGGAFGRWIESSRSSGSSHEESKSSSSSSSVSFGFGPPPPMGLPAGPSDDGLKGDWQLSLMRAPGTCRITFTDERWSNGYRISGGTDCPNNLFEARRWAIIGNGIQFLTIMGQPVAQFYARGPYEWVGRQSDGTKLILRRIR